MPSIDRNSSKPYYLQVYEQIARGIESGFYPAGKKLPSIRECARELGVSNTTVELAYQQLVAEGYVQAKRGSGYVICKITTAPDKPLERFTDDYRHAQEALQAGERERANQPKTAYDFAYDSVNAGTFPFTTWARICREVFFHAGAEAACLYNDPQGLHELREQIAYYLNGEYGVDCIPEQVLVTPTTRDLITEVVELFDAAGTTIAMGNPGYDEVRRRLLNRGYNLQPIPVHPYPNWEEAQRAIDGARIVFATPASQFPTNHAMPIDMRKAIVAWAQDNDAYLIDDEYGWEFQSGVQRIPSLAALDGSGRTITFGTFSNSFTPAVCLSYAVLPPQLMTRWREKRRGTHPQVPWQTQAAMAAFMEEGHWRTHIRKVRTASQHKRQLLLDALEEKLGDAVEIVESPNSQFVLVQAADGRGESELIEAAEHVGVRVYPTSQYWSDDPPADWRYVLVGYAGIPAEDIEPGVEALARAWA